MRINLKKVDVDQAVKLFKNDVHKACRKAYKRNVMEYTRLFGCKYRTYKQAKIKYAESDYVWLEDDSYYGKREISGYDSTIRNLELQVYNDVNDVISVKLDYVRQIEKYLKRK